MAEKGEKQRRITVAVNLTTSERNALGEIISASGFEMATVARCLLLALLNGKVRLPELLQKYQEKAKDPMHSSKSCDFKTSELRIHRICVRLTPKEKQELIVLARENFYRPAELVRILLKLFVMRIIRSSDIME